MFPNPDHGLTPGYIFTPILLEKGKHYPGLVAVHGGYHFSFGEEFFGYVVRAVAQGYVVIFPEYRGSRGYGAEHYRGAGLRGQGRGRRPCRRRLSRCKGIRRPRAAGDRGPEPGRDDHAARYRAAPRGSSAPRLMSWESRI